jgi:hypothetical protein
MTSKRKRGPCTVVMLAVKLQLVTTGGREHAHHARGHVQTAFDALELFNQHQQFAQL